MHFRTPTTLLTAALFSASLSACGSKFAEKIEEGKESADNVASARALSSQEQADSQEQAASQVQEALEALADDNQSQSLALTGTSQGFSLTDDAAPSESEQPEPARTCTANEDGTVTIVATRNWERAGSISGRFLTREVTTSVDARNTRVWTPAPDQDSLECTAANTVAIDWENSAFFEGLKLSSDIDHKRTASIEISGTRRNGENVSFALSREFSALGSREITHSQHSSDGTTVSVTRTVESDVTRTLSGTRRKAGSVLETESFSMSARNTTDSSDPLVIAVERIKGESAWSSKTVQSGTLKSVGSETGNTLVSQFSDLRFEYGNCVPVSGSVAGDIFLGNAEPASGEEESTQPNTSFVITFGADSESGVSISYDGGPAEDFPTVEDYLVGCSFSKKLVRKLNN